MKAGWIAIEMMAILIDGITIVYFLHSRYISKYDSITPQILAFLCLIGWGICRFFAAFPSLVNNGTTYIIALVYLLLTKRGTTGQKLFGVVLSFAFVLGSSLAGAGLASLVTNVRIDNTLLYQDDARLFAIILIKTIQIILFYVLTKKQYKLRALQKRPVIILTCVTITVLFCLVFLFVNLSGFDEKANYLFLWFACGLLFILVGIFLMYEMFIREETRNIDLSSRLQRLEIESQFFKELNILQTDLRTWRHEYKNNLIALRSLIENGSHEKALNYLDKISIESFQESTLLHTGNPVLDAVVSSKLMFARTNNIAVNIQVVYPENNSIEPESVTAPLAPVANGRARPSTRNGTSL